MVYFDLFHSNSFQFRSQIVDDCVFQHFALQVHLYLIIEALTAQDLCSKGRFENSTYMKSLMFSWLTLFSPPYCQQKPLMFFNIVFHRRTLFLVFMEKEIL